MSQPQVAQLAYFPFYEGETHREVQLLKTIAHELYLDRVRLLFIAERIYIHTWSPAYNSVSTGNVFNIHFMRATLKHKLFISKRNCCNKRKSWLEWQDEGQNNNVGSVLCLLSHIPLFKKKNNHISFISYRFRKWFYFGVANKKPLYFHSAQFRGLNNDPFFTLSLFLLLRVFRLVGAFTNLKIQES